MNIEKWIKRTVISLIAFVVGIKALIIGIDSYDEYQSDPMIKAALACDLESSSDPSITKSYQTIYRLLVGQREASTPNEVYAPVAVAGMPSVRDKDLDVGERTITSSGHKLWNLDGAVYVHRSSEKLLSTNNLYKFTVESGGEILTTTFHRQTLAYHAFGPSIDIKRQCRLMDASKIHEAVRADQETAPVNKI